MRGSAIFSLAALLLLLAPTPQAQEGTAPAIPLTLLSPDGRGPVPTLVLNGAELIALDEVSDRFGVTVRDDALAGGITLTYNSQTVVVSNDQPMASVGGRIVALPSPARRLGNRWFVPLELLPRALGPIYDSRIDLRRASRLLIVGDLRVPRVTGRIDTIGPPTRATIEIAPAAPVSVTTEAGRLVVHIDADAVDLLLPATGGGLIERIRGGELPMTVAFDLGSQAGVARGVPTEVDGVTRVAIDIAGPALAGAGSTPGGAETPPAPSVLPPAGAAVAPLLAGPRARLETIVIDPGHGGDDTGVMGSGATAEKTIALAVAQRLRALIETRLGIRVILTRGADQSVSLDERAAIANNSKADLFLSLHMNAAPAASVAGAEVISLRLDREGEDARQVAAREAVSLPVLGGSLRSIDLIQWDLAQARHVDASAVLAQMLEEQLRARVTMSSRPRQRAALRVLAAVDMPAALVEMAYLTNPEQAQLARSENFQTSVAQGIYDAIVAFRAYLEVQAAP
ncbi:MAG: N-acetylmuramoyl-L-alanine amidase [Acidobacteria bacterium]|nr:N-acetylmuramoyl-L-alanine amidase [Acidobacteriota bacterium]